MPYAAQLLQTVKGSTREFIRIEESIMIPTTPNTPTSTYANFFLTLVAAPDCESGSALLLFPEEEAVVTTGGGGVRGQARA